MYELQKWVNLISESLKFELFFNSVKIITVWMLTVQQSHIKYIGKGEDFAGCI